MDNLIVYDVEPFDLEVEQPKWLLSTPTAVYAAESLLELVWLVLRSKPVWRA